MSDKKIISKSYATKKPRKDEGSIKSTTSSRGYCDAQLRKAHNAPIELGQASIAGSMVGNGQGSLPTVFKLFADANC